MPNLQKPVMAIAMTLVLFSGSFAAPYADASPRYSERHSAHRHHAKPQQKTVVVVKKMYPVGYRAKALPVGYRKVIVSGKPYFYAKGNYYRWLPKTATYVVVKNPGAAFG